MTENTNHPVEHCPRSSSPGLSLFITHVTVIDGVATHPLPCQTIAIEGSRIRAIGKPAEFGTLPRGATVLDGSGKFAIPGLMNANAHLLLPVSLERLARHYGQYDELISEAAQVALRSGLTTVFDTWGPRRVLMSVRDQIATGKTPGCRIFCAGNIVGFDGPCSVDFNKKFASAATPSFIRNLDAIWVENVGRHLMWLTPTQVQEEVRRYLSKGIDFLKYASNEHGSQAAGAFIQFSPRVQEVIVSEAHRAGVTAQAHCMTVEGLRIALDAGCDLITHCNLTGPIPIPDSTLELFTKKRVGAVVFPFTERRLQWLYDSQLGNRPIANADLMRTMYGAADQNVRQLIASGATLLLGNDAGLWPPELLVDPDFSRQLGADVDNYLDISEGHHLWFKAMAEKGCKPLDMLRAATKNIAAAYGKDADLGTLEPGKLADILILDKNPLEDVTNYRSIRAIVKDGRLVDRSTLPVRPILEAPVAPPPEEVSAYVPFLGPGQATTCPICICAFRAR